MSPIVVELLSHVQLFATPWTVAHQAPLSMGFPRQECWSGLPFPSLGDLPNPGVKPGSPALQADALTSEPPGSPLFNFTSVFKWIQFCPPSFALPYLLYWAFQAALVVKNWPTNAGDIRDMGSIPRLGRSPREGQGNPCQYSCLENPMDRGARRAPVRRVTKNWT